MRDLPLVRRLSEQGICLDAESAVTRSYHPLRGALFSMIGGGDASIYVWRAEKGDAAGFVQVRIVDDLNARLVRLAVSAPENGNTDSEPLDETAWLTLLDDVVAAIGRRGIHSLIAEANEDGVELTTLRRAGFAVYTRQDIWVLQRGGVSSSGSRSSAVLQPRRSNDDWDIEWLYANTVPPLIQLVEPSPPENGDLWVLREEGELTAFAHIAKGSGATWMQIFIHPNAYAQAEDIVNASVQVCEDEEQQPIFCCVRRYQSWLRSALESSGFALWDSQAVMVKHMSTPVTKKVGALDRLLSAHGVRPTTLLQRYQSAPEHDATLCREERI